MVVCIAHDCLRLQDGPPYVRAFDLQSFIHVGSIPGGRSPASELRY